MKGKLMIMLLLIGSILFGAPVQQSATLHLRLKIDPVHEVKILKEEPANVGAFNRASTIPKHVFTESATTGDTYYMVVKTNNKSAVKINVTVENMKSADTNINTQIAYKISAGDITITSTNTARTRNLFKEVIPLGKNGMRIVSQPFTIALNSSNVSNATAATYTSNITFNLIAP